MPLLSRGRALTDPMEHGVLLPTVHTRYRFHLQLLCGRDVRAEAACEKPHGNTVFYPFPLPRVPSHQALEWGDAHVICSKVPQVTKRLLLPLSAP